MLTVLSMFITVLFFNPLSVLVKMRIKVSIKVLSKVLFMKFIKESIMVLINVLSFNDFVVYVGL